MMSMELESQTISETDLGCLYLLLSPAELGIYPAVDPLDSTSRIMDPNIVGEEHYNVARGVQKILQVMRVSECGRV